MDLDHLTSILVRFSKINEYYGLEENDDSSPEDENFQDESEGKDRTTEIRGLFIS